MVAIVLFLVCCLLIDLLLFLGLPFLAGFITWWGLMLFVDFIPAQSIVHFWLTVIVLLGSFWVALWTAKVIWIDGLKDF